MHKNVVFVTPVPIMLATIRKQNFSPLTGNNILVTGAKGCCL